MYVHISAGASNSQKGASKPLELELQAAVKQEWM